MSKITVLPVSPADLLAHWPLVEGLIARALPCASKRFLPEDVLAYCIQNIAQGWFIRDGDQILAVMITKIEQYPRQRCLCIFALSGERMADFYDEVEAVLTEYARRMACTQFEVQGRRGWGPVLGLEARSTVFVKELLMEAPMV